VGQGKKKSKTNKQTNNPKAKKRKKEGNFPFEGLKPKKKKT